MTLEDSWDKYTGKAWLKAEQVQDENQAFVVLSVDVDENERPLLELQSGEIKGSFSVNVTNACKLKEYTNSPKNLIGKKLFFRKVVVTSPTTKKEVDTLRVTKVE